MRTLYIQLFDIILKKKSLNYPRLPLARGIMITLSGSNCLRLEQISTTPNIFKPMRFDSIISITTGLGSDLTILIDTLCVHGRYGSHRQ